MTAVIIIGGGRWARQMICALRATPFRSSPLHVHSRSNADGIRRWCAERGIERLGVTDGWPPPSTPPAAVIVANATRDHEHAARWALESGHHVLVEKPVAASAAAAMRLTSPAVARGRVAAAHVFLFARYVGGFTAAVQRSGRPTAIRVEWSDPLGEQRYGEAKQIDRGLTVFADWLPHVVSIVGWIQGTLPSAAHLLDIARGGASLNLTMRAGDVPWSVHLERDAAARTRVIEVSTARGERLTLDFSREPGTIVAGDASRSGDPDWDAAPRPLASMLEAFVEWAGGGAYDVRLDPRPGVRACELADGLESSYTTAQSSWLLEHLDRKDRSTDSGLRYALAERLGRATGDGSADDDRTEVLLRELRAAGDPSRLLQERTRG